MHRLVLVLVILLTIYSCEREQKSIEEYPLQVGDINFDADLDNPDFKLCDEAAVLQYYNFGKGVQYRGEKLSINNYFEDKFKARDLEGDTGFITVRFIVNCEGKTGRHRIEGMDYNFKKKEFSKELTSSLLQLTKEMDGWLTSEYDGKAYDYYQYLTFKMEKGRLMEIMP